MLELIEVAKAFGGTQVLQPTTLRFERGKTTVLIGPSGCGKSTLLRIMIGLVEPDQGQVLIDGQRLTPASVLALRRKIGYVIQDGGLFPHLSALDNVGLLARHLSWSKPEVRSRVEKLAELTRLPPEALAKYPAQLSGGQRQRLGIMRALMLDPEVILLDEPTSGVSTADKHGIMRTLVDAAKKAGVKAVILVEHDMDLVASYSQRVVALTEGKVLADLPPDQFFADPHIVATVVGKRRGA
jgi:osmoprotectant transport system ATP-binding protein